MFTYCLTNVTLHQLCPGVGGRPLSHYSWKEAEGDHRRLPHSPPPQQVSSRPCQSEGSAGDRGQEGRLVEGVERGGLPGTLSALGSPAPLRTRDAGTHCLFHLGRTLLASLPFQRPPPTLSPSLCLQPACGHHASGVGPASWTWARRALPL